jgi:hypothetical protein
MEEDPLVSQAVRKSGSAYDLTPVKHEQLTFLNSFLQDQIN